LKGRERWFSPRKEEGGRRGGGIRENQGAMRSGKGNKGGRVCMTGKCARGQQRRENNLQKGRYFA